MTDKMKEAGSGSGKVQTGVVPGKVDSCKSGKSGKK